MSTANSTNWSETLTRLSSKTGVKSALVLDRSLSTVLLSTGSFSWLRATSAPIASTTPSITSNPVSATDENNQKDQGVEELALMVWNYVGVTETLVQGIDSEDDLKLLRLRTRKHELVIVPDAKYIFVVVHEVS